MYKMQLKRKLLGLRAIDVAVKLGISQTYYSAIEGGFLKPKNKKIYERIAEVLDLKPEELFEEVTL